MYIFKSEDVLNLYESELEFNIDVLNLLYNFKLNKISLNYIANLLNDTNNKIMFYCFDENFDINNCPTLIIYNYIFDEDIHAHNYYILLMCTKFKFRGLGYASLLMNDFIQYIKNINSTCQKNIIVSSVEEAVTFYESHGFKWTRENITNYPMLLEYEKYEDGKEYFILKYVI